MRSAAVLGSKTSTSVAVRSSPPATALPVTALRRHLRRTLRREKIRRD
jgi:hypothetical protein